MSQRPELVTEVQIEARKKLAELLDDESDGMTGWETDFVEDLSHRRNVPLSDKQIAKIEDIHERVLG